MAFQMTISMGSAISAAFPSAARTTPSSAMSMGNGIAPSASGIAFANVGGGMSGAGFPTEDDTARRAARQALKGSNEVRNDLHRLEQTVGRVQTIAFSAFAIAGGLKSGNANSMMNAAGMVGLEASRSMLSEDGWLNRGLRKTRIKKAHIAEVGGAIGYASSTLMAANMIAEVLQAEERGNRLKTAFEVADAMATADPKNANTYYRLSGATLRNDLAPKGHLFAEPQGALAYLVGSGISDALTWVNRNAPTWMRGPGYREWQYSDTGAGVQKRMGELQQTVAGVAQMDLAMFAKVTGQTREFAKMSAGRSMLDPKEVSAMAEQLAVRWSNGWDASVTMLADDFKTYRDGARQYAENFARHERANVQHRRVRELMT